MKLIEETAQKEGAHKIKNAYWTKNGIEVERYGLPCGDYIICNEKVQELLDRKAKRGIDVKKMDFLGTYKVSVDTKENMLEIVGNICGKSHDRFRDECVLASNNGIQLYVLVENQDGIKEVRDVFKWQNPRTHRYNKIAYMHRLGKWQNIKLPKSKPTSGETLAKAMLTMEAKYGVKFLFCKPSEAGAKVIELLTMGE